jgi:hypothetical protein
MGGSRVAELKGPLSWSGPGHDRHQARVDDESFRWA